MLIGHGTVRLGAMRTKRTAPSATEMAAMRATVSEGIAAGALGLSSGLLYQPGCFAATEELVELTSLLRGTGGLYATHMRDEGLGLLDAVREAITIGAAAGVPVQISHHKAFGRAAWGLVRESLRLIEDARVRGVFLTEVVNKPMRGESRRRSLSCAASTAAGTGGCGVLP